MATVWLLISISTGFYNNGTVSSIEFTSQEQCQATLEIMQKDPLIKNITQSFCVKK